VTAPVRPLFGKVAVVTGGGSGLGAATARRLASEGAHVIVADIDDDRAESVERAIANEGNDVESSVVDVTHEGEVAAMFEAIVEQHGRVDVLVCSAAVETRANVVDTTDAVWRHVLDVNLKGPFLCMKYGIPPMVGAGGGSVILLGSILGAIGSPGYAAYCASKGALVNLAKQAAVEHAPDGIRVNVVSPSACETGLFLEMVSRAPDPDAIKQMVADRTPMGRLGTEEDVVATIMFLVGDGASYISGTTIPLDGGLASRRGGAG
jgi:meso-butanediol dehydrogenase / (S,S)-butanediol dehydrogenase / diacetyl reductase